MKFYQCKCGNVTSWSSIGVADCVACGKCGSDLAEGPAGHREPAAHEYVTKYDQNTGKPYEICRSCLAIRPASVDQVAS